MFLDVFAPSVCLRLRLAQLASMVSVTAVGVEFAQRKLGSLLLRMGFRDWAPEMCLTRMFLNLESWYEFLISMFLVATDLKFESIL